MEQKKYRRQNLERKNNSGMKILKMVLFLVIVSIIWWGLIISFIFLDVFSLDVLTFITVFFTIFYEIMFSFLVLQCFQSVTGIKKDDKKLIIAAIIITLFINIWVIYTHSSYSKFQYGRIAGGMGMAGLFLFPICFVFAKYLLSIKEWERLSLNFTITIIIGIILYIFYIFSYAGSIVIN